MARIKRLRRPALLIGMALAILAGGAARIWGEGASAVLFGWCVGVIGYLAMALWTGFRMTAHTQKARASEIDEGQNMVLGATVAATLVSLVAVVVDLAGSHGSPRAAGAAMLAGVTVALSWAFVHVLFAHRYAHEQALRGGLEHVCFKLRHIPSVEGSFGTRWG